MVKANSISGANDPYIVCSQKLEPDFSGLTHSAPLRRLGNGKGDIQVTLNSGAQTCIYDLEYHTSLNSWRFIKTTPQGQVSMSSFYSADANGDWSFSDPGAADFQIIHDNSFNSNNSFRIHVVKESVSTPYHY